MLDFTNYLIFIAAIGVVSLSVPMLIMRSGESHVYLMLSVFLGCGIIANMLPLLIEFRPSIQRFSLAILVPAYFLQPVFLWFYVKGLCSPTRWAFSAAHKSHYILSMMSFVFAIAALLLPEADM